MLYSLLITLREGFEIALIVAIVLSYLVKTGRRHAAPQVWLGAALAAAACLALGIAVQLSARQLSGRALEAFEGGAMLFAVTVLTWMLFWMRRQAASLGRHLRAQVDAALQGGGTLPLALLAASAVGREGLETVLFLVAGASTAESGLSYVLGGAGGFVIAATLGWLVYRGAARLPVRAFFTVTGIAVVVLAAGLLSNGLGELREAGLLPSLGGRVWDTEHLLAMTSTPGRFLHAILGYDSSPLLGQVIAYWLYLALALGMFVAVPRLTVRRIARQTASVAS
jgi:high-affinity iron transporter